MRVIIAGSREITDQELIAAAVAESGFTITCVVSGTARGVDRMGEVWAEQNNIRIDRYPANWDLHGRRHAGHIRNKQMADNADALIALWDGKSTGTRNMIDIAESAGLPVYIKKIRLEPAVQQATVSDYLAAKGF